MGRSTPCSLGWGPCSRIEPAVLSSPLSLLPLPWQGPPEGARGDRAKPRQPPVTPQVSSSTACPRNQSPLAPRFVCHCQALLHSRLTVGLGKHARGPARGGGNTEPCGAQRAGRVTEKGTQARGRPAPRCFVHGGGGFPRAAGLRGRGPPGAAGTPPAGGSGGAAVRGAEGGGGRRSGRVGAAGGAGSGGEALGRLGQGSAKLGRSSSAPPSCSDAAAGGLAGLAADAPAWVSKEKRGLEARGSVRGPRLACRPEAGTAQASRHTDQRVPRVML